MPCLPGPISGGMPCSDQGLRITTAAPIAARTIWLSYRRIALPTASYIGSQSVPPMPATTVSFPRPACPHPPPPTLAPPRAAIPTSHPLPDELVPSTPLTFEEGVLLYLRYMCRTGDQSCGLLEGLDKRLRRCVLVCGCVWV